MLIFPCHRRWIGLKSALTEGSKMATPLHGPALSLADLHM
jgi:hypothetical protein